MPHYELSEEQEEFIAEAEQKGFKVDLNFSNKFEKGRTCPAVHVKSLKSAVFKGKNLQCERTPNGFIIYAPY